MVGEIPSEYLHEQRNARRHGFTSRPVVDTEDDGEHQRSPAQTDRDRLLYTSAWRRLAGVTQVVSPTEGHVFHNRMTHTLEVAQIGRRLAERLVAEYPHLLSKVGGIDPDVVEAASLAHDLGHPPFGHIAEKELQVLLDDDYPYLPGSFEGNAQSFRIVTALAVHRASLTDRELNYPGLNLTRATLNATLKYPYERGTEGSTRHKWGVYESEGDDFAWARSGVFALGENRSVEAELMDWSDDVAYSVHDVEDFYRAGIIPLDRLARPESPERERFLERVFERRAAEQRDDGHTNGELRAAFTELLGLISGLYGITEPYDGSRQHRGQLRRLTSMLINRYIRALHLTENPDDRGRWVQKSPREEAEVKMLKALTFEYVVNNPSLATQQLGQRQIIRTLFQTYYEAAMKRDEWNLFPLIYQDELRGIEGDGQDARARQMRTVIDFIASMTEHQALRMYQRITGHVPGSVMERL